MDYLWHFTVFQNFEHINEDDLFIKHANTRGCPGAQRSSNKTRRKSSSYKERRLLFSNIQN